MRTIILATTAVIALAGSASAQMSPGKFCLRGMNGDAKGMESCAYETMAQCNAAKAGESDLCVPNSSMHGAAKTTTTGTTSKH